MSQLQLPDDVPGEVQVILGETKVFVVVRQTDNKGARKIVAIAEKEVGHLCPPTKIRDVASLLLDNFIVPRVRQLHGVQQSMPGIDVELVEADWRRLGE